MKYVLVENGQVTKTRLPRTGTLKDGSTVSNYNLLPHEILLAEGWLPLIDDPPETDLHIREACMKSFRLILRRLIGLLILLPAFIRTTRLKGKLKTGDSLLGLMMHIGQGTLLPITEILTHHL